jgi:hypothetical protein
MTEQFVVYAIILVVAIAYWFLRVGPKRCPNCNRFAWGIVKVPAGVSRMHFHCRHCGTHFEARWFLG